MWLAQIVLGKRYAFWFGELRRSMSSEAAMGRVHDVVSDVALGRRIMADCSVGVLS